MEKEKLFVETLTSPYNSQQFVDFIKEMISGVKIIAPGKANKPYNTFSYYIPQYFHVGEFTDPEKNAVGIFAVELTRDESVERARTTQRSFVKSLLQQGNYSAALVAFYSKGDYEKWRFSFIRMDYEFSKGKITENLTPAKRYSYLVGKGEPCHTAMDRLYPIFNDDTKLPTIDEIEEAFSVEPVTKQFFEAYKNKYIEMYEFLEKNEDFVRESKLKNFTTEQFTKKLLSQIVFLYFIQKKGWLGVGAVPKTLTEKEYKNAFFSHGSKSRELVGKVYYQDGELYRRNAEVLKNLSAEDENELSKCVKGQAWGTGPRNFMRAIFDDCSKRGMNFFDDYLEPLFYTGLNKDRSEYNDFFPPLHCRIPFLNGGLFEELEHYDWKYNNFGIPNSLFSNVDGKDRNEDGILDIFDRYNFTMAEDEPLEKEVAIDPEMLGKVFENLLEVKNRKSTGAFYTPREIVHYMCQESLINYLVTKTEIPDDDIRKFITLGEHFRDEDTRKTIYNSDTKKYEFDYGKELEMPSSIIDFKNNVNRIEELDNLLKTVRVADPAVGSGAFPLGLLNEIVKARETLTQYFAIPMNGFQRKILYAQRSPYQLKTETIKNCIFACDIEPSATDITKLRLWLALVIDDEITENTDEINQFDEHSKPKKLPNLDCNILCGNSLLDSFNGIKLSTENSDFGRDESQFLITALNVGDYIKQLIKYQDLLYNATSREDKEALKHKIQTIYDEAICDQLENCGEDAVEEYFQSTKLNSKPFILWQLYFPRVFKDNGGFDIIIGNPPYIGESGNKEIFREIASTHFGAKYYCGKMDYFYFFFHKALDISNQTGEVALITTNYYPTATGAKNLRKDLRKRAQIRQMFNFNNVKVFESALGQHNMITLLTKANNNAVECKSVICNGSYVVSSNQLREMLNNPSEQEVFLLDQNNLYEGEDAYIRQRGIHHNGDLTIDSIVEKMGNQLTRLGDVAEINQGVVSGCDTVANRNMKYLDGVEDVVKDDGIYVFDLSNDRDCLKMDSFSSNNSLLRDFYKNSNIGKYYCDHVATKKILYFTGELNKDNYLNEYLHLEKYKPLLEHRLVAYNEHYHWTSLHRPRNEKIFTGPKIVVPYRTNKNSFAYNEIEWFCRSDCYIITKKNKNTDLFYLLGVLNSKLAFVWLYFKGKRKGETLELFQIPLSEIPLFPLKEYEMKTISKLAQKITEIKSEDKNRDTEVLEKEIDEILYHSLQLSEDEIVMINDFMEGRS